MSGHRAISGVGCVLVMMTASVVTGALAQTAPTTTKPPATTTTAKPATATPATPKPTPVKLAAADIQSTFGTGSAFVASNVGGQTYSYLLKPDGTASRTAKGAKTAETGTWHAADAAGYCVTWGKGTEHCYAIAKPATGTSYDVMDMANKVIAHWTPAKTT